MLKIANQCRSASVLILNFPDFSRHVQWRMIKFFFIKYNWVIRQKEITEIAIAMFQTSWKW